MYRKVARRTTGTGVITRSSLNIVLTCAYTCTYINTMFEWDKTKAAKNKAKHKISFRLNNMSTKYDFSKARRGSVVAADFGPKLPPISEISYQ